ncbi:WLM-domain-containing protein, partial [Thozetella sp. PMI_491]
MLKKIASLVKPIMRARGWKVGELAEFYPDQQNLLGLNVNKGQKILLRLRYPSDRSLFLPIEQVTDTMLHELSHIVHGPHDAKFHALWNQLRDEHEGLALKGYTGEGFLSEGHRLGGRNIPMSEARRLARAQAERRRDMNKGSGQRLGGAVPRPGSDIRRVIATAAERRNRALQGCGNTTHNDREIQEISDNAIRNGFRTQAEEDAANEAAIAQALWELVQEDEKAKYGSSYVPPSAENPSGSGGGVFVDDDVTAGPLTNKGESSTAAPPEAKPAASELAVPADSWTCGVCTLINEPNFLSCDACGTEKVEKPGKRPREVVDLTASPSRPSTKKPTKARELRTFEAPPVPPGLETWQCSFCGKLMERQWWTCSVCGVMKNSS